MDKALASGAGDCGFESHRDRFYVEKTFYIVYINQIDCF
ncbi:hypothetical protein Pint_18140 [Pistacia integerrima]|uniref:Uncharacterized protein n=1 Tax=Pistacia integerrima TaxID=434235 RepID=A0ACC0Z181_9ROSI|nr:hypothetical protein Pint_18140 [Pistacia integerrima]